jgi:hypothetical protein
MAAFVLAFGAAIVGAILGAYLQKRWTPDQSVETAALREQVSALRGQVATFQAYIEKVEKERADIEHFPLHFSLRQAAQGNYIVLVQNDSNDDVRIDSVRLTRNEIDLSGAAKPAKPDEWGLSPHSGKQISWSPPHDPTATMQLTEPNLGPGVPVPIAVVIMFQVRGKTHEKRRVHLVTVDYRNRCMTAYGP